MSSPLRTFLFCPATEPGKIAKLRGSGADAGIIDLEDSVSESLKEEARSQARKALSSQAFANYPLYVRINSISSGLAEADIAGIMHPNLDGVVLPKSENPDGIRLVADALMKAEISFGVPVGRTRIIPLIETARGVHRAVDILGASPRIETAIFGFIDYMLDVGIHQIDHTPDAVELLYARSALVLACRVAGVKPPLDGPFLGVHQRDALLAQARQARSLGFSGKVLIHPSQVSPAQEGLSPSESEVQQAQNIITAFAEAGRSGVAAMIVDDRMVDYPVVDRARRIVEAAL